MNEALLNFNNLSEATYRIVHDKYSKHCKTLSILQKDLDQVFRRIR